MEKFLTLSLLCLAFITSIKRSNAAYNVVQFGAKPDGRSDSTQAFLRAWSAACESKRPAMVYVPKGRFVVRSITFAGPCKSRVMFVIGGTLLAPTDYYEIGNLGHWIMFYKVSRVSVHGGALDARGAAFWACRNSGRSCPTGGRSISIMWCNNFVISGLTSINSQIMNIAIDHSTNVVIQKSRILAPSTSPNTDGIHIESSSGIIISRSVFMTGDDCISIGQGSKSMWIDRVICGPGHGISIGSLGSYENEEGVENVTVTSSVFKGTQNGVRIKAWARPVKGYVRNVEFRNLVMKNVYNPIIIDQMYCPGNRGCPHQSSGINISDVSYKNIKGSSATQVAMNFICSSSNPCRGIKLQNINLKYPKKPTLSMCQNADGSSKGMVVPRSCL